MKKYFLLIAALSALTLVTAQPGPSRVPAYPGVITRVQPDNDTLHVYLRGDEWSHFMMTTDGYQVKERNNGQICYCKLNQDGSVKITCRQAHDSTHRKPCEVKWLKKHGIKKMDN